MIILIIVCNFWVKHYNVVSVWHKHVNVVVLFTYFIICLCNVTVAAVQHSANGKCIWNKKLVCFICRAEVLWLSRHFKRQHSEHFLVAKVLATTGLNRSNGLKRLKNLGSFRHNLDVLKKGVGQILVARRPKDSHAADGYISCYHCYGFYHQYELFWHMCPCLANSSSER